ncbi:MAG: LVIVD repeat-containing protein, partial [Roseiflexaceae bacterium]
MTYGPSESQSGILVLDVSNPQTPVPVGRSERLNAGVTALLIVKGYLYMFGTNVSVLKLVTPARPVLVATLGVAGAYPLVVGRYLYFSNGIYPNERGFYIVDTVKPEQPALVGWVATVGAGMLGSDGRYLTVAHIRDQNGLKPGLEVFDLANPTRPLSIAKYDTLWLPSGLAIYGRYAYVFEGTVICDEAFCNHWAILHRFDLSVPGRPQPIKDIPLNPNNYQLNKMLIIGQRLYLGYKSETWEIYDLAQPTTPVLLGTGSGILDAVADSKVFALADSGDTMSLIDIADPTHPRILGSHRLVRVEGQRLALHGQVAYLDRSPFNTIVANISDPHWPALITTASFGFNELVDTGTVGYAAGGAAALRTIDTSDPLRPTRLGDLPASEGMRLQQVAVAGRYAYVGDEYFGLRVLDLINPAKPIQVGSLKIAAWVHSLTVSGTYVYLSTPDGPTLIVVNVSNPAQPTLVRSITLPNPAGQPDRPLAIVGNKLYLASDGLRVFALSNPANPTLLGSLNQPAKATDMVVANGYAYIIGTSPADHPNGGLWVVNVANPAQPALARVIDMSVDDGRVALDGSRLYVRANQTQTVIFNLATPANLQQIATVTTPFAKDITVQGNYIFALLFDNASHVQAIDIADPAKPRVVSDIPLPFGLAWDLQGQGNLLYAAVEQSLRVIDRTDPRQLKEIGAYFHVFGTGGIAVAGHYAYLTAGDLGLHIVDIADPWHLRPVGYNYRLGDTSSIAIAGTYAYVTTLRGDFGRFVGLLVVDISDPANPVEVASLTMLDAYIGVGSVLDILIQGQYAYVATGAGGVYVIDISNPLHPTVATKLVTTAATKLALDNNYLFV